MTSRPPVKLSELRRIGWTVWDPIGIYDQVGPGLNQGPADEYDRYMMVAFGMVQSGRSKTDIFNYISDIASGYMGLGEPTDDGKANRETVKALVALAQSLT